MGLKLERPPARLGSIVIYRRSPHATPVSAIVIDPGDGYSVSLNVFEMDGTQHPEHGVNYDDRGALMNAWRWPDDIQT